MKKHNKQISHVGLSIIMFLICLMPCTFVLGMEVFDSMKVKQEVTPSYKKQNVDIYRFDEEIRKETNLGVEGNSENEGFEFEDKGKDDITLDLDEEKSKVTEEEQLVIAKMETDILNESYASIVEELGDEVIEEPLAEVEIPREYYIPVLMYHHFTEEQTDKTNSAITSIASFEEHLKAFTENGYTPIFAEDLYELLVDENNKERFDKKYICITMDDGYSSNYELAYPVLKKYDYKASISVITSRIGIVHKNDVGYPKLIWDNLNEMQESGNVRVYCHSLYHDDESVYFGTTINKNVSIADKMLDDNMINRAGKVYAYPSGKYTRLNQVLLRQLGFDIQLTTNFGVVTLNTAVDNIPRINVDSEVSSDELLDLIDLAVKRTIEK